MKNNIFLNKQYNKSIVAGGIVAILLIITAIFAPLIAPNDPLAVDVSKKFLGFSKDYWLGTDNLGRCIASRLIWGTRYSLFYGFIVLVFSFTFGTAIGLISGYAGGITDLFVMRAIDIGLALPGFMVAFAIAGTLGPGIWHIVMAVSLVWWTPYARLVRGITIKVKESDYVKSAIASGCGHTKILFKHIFRNVFPSALTMASMEIGGIILTLAGFSFLGLGIQPPKPEWGIMISDSRSFIQTHPQLIYYPGIAIMIDVMAFNLLGEGINNVVEGK